MPLADLVRLRFHNQRLSGPPLDRAEDVVRLLGAVQAQDYGPAKWGLGLRTKAASDATVERAIADGAIVRTHVMRPTWHFVAPEDVRWLIALTAPRVNALCASYYRKYELDDRTFAKSRAVIVRSLQGGRHLTRRQLALALEKARVIRSTDDPLRVVFLIMRAELEALVCSGAPAGKQLTYALLDERVPAVKAIDRDDAVGRLAARYFTSHGPATINDFSWWSGLTMGDGKAGVEAANRHLEREAIDGQVYWRARNAISPERDPDTAYLLPAYDEALLSYRDTRSAFAAHRDTAVRDYGQVIVIDGRLVGAWRRVVAGGAVSVVASPIAPLARRERTAIERAVERYGRFLELPVTFEVA